MPFNPFRRQPDPKPRPKPSEEPVIDAEPTPEEPRSYLLSSKGCPHCPGGIGYKAPGDYQYHCVNPGCKSSFR